MALHLCFSVCKTVCTRASGEFSFGSQYSYFGFHKNMQMKTIFADIFFFSLFYLKIFRHFIVNSNTPYKPKWKAKMGTKNRVESTTTNGEQRKKRCCANIKEQIEHVRIQILHFPLIFFPFIVDLFFQL